MHFELEDLRRISEKIFAHLEELGLDSFDISSVDYYWNIPKEQVYNPYEEPSDFTLGQLTDDWNELHRVIESEIEPFGYDLVRLSAILRAIGENTPG